MFSFQACLFDSWRNDTGPKPGILPGPADASVLRAIIFPRLRLSHVSQCPALSRAKRTREVDIFGGWSRWLLFPGLELGPG